MNQNNHNALSVLTIDLSALSKNYKFIQSQTKAMVGAAVKANAYGIGAVHATNTLYDAGCRHFFVATVDEAAQIADISAPKDSHIFVLGSVQKDAQDFCAAKHIIPVLNTPDDTQQWKDLSIRQGRALPCAVHVDTGMNRLGLSITDIPASFEGLNVRILMSHFACADEKGHPMNDHQAARFLDIAKKFPDISKSLCNSSGTFRNPAWHYELLRPGYALYGGNPTPESANPMRPVVSLQARILQVRNVKKGESAGYAAGHVFEQDTKTATVAMGYADGLPRSGSGKVKFYYQGKACPVLGRISMDTTIVDIGPINPAPSAGEYMDILGVHQDVDALADACGTIGYEILTSLGHRHHRIYKK